MFVCSSKHTKMEGILLFGVILILTIIILPIVSLSKLSSIERKLTELEKALNRANQTSEKKRPAEQAPADAETTAIPQEEKHRPAKVPEVIVKAPEVIVKAPEPVKVAEPEEEAKPEIPVFITFGESEEEFRKPAGQPEIIKPAATKKAPLKKGQGIKFENMLSKIGIITLVLGVGFFVKYAIDRDWINEIGRVGIGLLAGGALIAIAHKLREKYNLFSAIMVGGGISVLYITITLAFREYQLFSQPVAFGILIAVTAFSVVLSLLYNRKELALFSLLGGYASPLMISTGEGNYIVLFSFLLILNSGMLFISMRKKWNIIGFVSFFCTLLFYWGWLSAKFEAQYTGALVFGGLFFVQFYLLALSDHFLSGRKVFPFQVIVILANNASMFAAAIYIFQHTGLRIQGLITIIMAAVNAAVMLMLFRRASIDKRLLYLIIAIVLSFVSLAVPVQLDGHVITMFWAAEMVILLWMWNKTGIKVFQAGFLLITSLTLISYAMDAFYNYRQYAELSILFNRVFITGTVTIASLAMCRYLLARSNQEAEGFFSVSSIRRGITLALILAAYFVPFLEINYQLSISEADRIEGFRLMNLASYTIIYIATIALIYRKKISASWIYALAGVVALYTITALPVVIGTRWESFMPSLPDFAPSLFYWHYIALPALAYIVYAVVSRLKALPKNGFIALSWGLVVCSVVILSVELDNTVVLLGGTPDNYDELLFDSRTFGYPILWGVLAMLLMLWGLKRKEVLLRQISLVFFAFIILKFYISDIWLMSQTGRIVSFVALGIILLMASFLIQKIKVLIKEDKEDEASNKE